MPRTEQSNPQGLSHPLYLIFNNSLQIYLINLVERVPNVVYSLFGCDICQSSLHRWRRRALHSVPFLELGRAIGPLVEPNIDVVQHDVVILLVFLFGSLIKDAVRRQHFLKLRRQPIITSQVVNIPNTNLVSNFRTYLFLLKQRFHELLDVDVDLLGQLVVPLLDLVLALGTLLRHLGVDLFELLFLRGFKLRLFLGVLLFSSERDLHLKTLLDVLLSLVLILRVFLLELLNLLILLSLQFLQLLP